MVGIVSCGVYIPTFRIVRNNEMMDVWRKPEDRHVRMFDAKEAYEMGLLNKIVPPEELQKEFMELARTFPRVRREPML